MLATTSHVTCARYRLFTSVNTAWEAATKESDELSVLDTSSNNLVKFVKKSGSIQYNLPATLKSGQKTRPWRSLISKLSSIVTSYEALRPLLRDKDLIVSIEKSLLEEVLGILKKTISTFDILEFSFFQHCILCYLHSISCVIFGQRQKQIQLQAVFEKTFS